MSAQYIAGMLKVRTQAFDFAPKITAVIHEGQVGQFVRHDVVDDR